MTETEFSKIIGIPARVLITLYRSDSIPVTSLQEKSKISPTALYNALRKLLQLGLIMEEREKDFPRRRLISLTGKGWRVARLLVQIEEILSV